MPKIHAIAWSFGLISPPPMEITVYFKPSFTHYVQLVAVVIKVGHLVNAFGWVWAMILPAFLSITTQVSMLLATEQSRIRWLTLAVTYITIVITRFTNSPSPLLFTATSSNIALCQCAAKSAAVRYANHLPPIVISADLATRLSNSRPEFNQRWSVLNVLRNCAIAPVECNHAPIEHSIMYWRGSRPSVPPLASASVEALP